MSIADKGDTTPRVAGLTFDQWATLAAQMPPTYAPTYPDAIRMRADWLRSERVVNTHARDEKYAHALFRNVQAENYAVHAIESYR